MDLKNAPTANPRAAAKRPRGIAIVAVIQFLFGALSVIGAIGSLSVSRLPPPRGLGFLQPLAPVFPIVLLVVGAFLLLLSFGLWRGLRWAWTLTLAFESVHVIADIGFVAARSFALDKIIGLAIIAGMLIYLTRPRVRAYFHREES
jgi:hypothetical protein